MSQRPNNNPRFEVLTCGFQWHDDYVLPCPLEVKADIPAGTSYLWLGYERDVSGAWWNRIFIQGRLTRLACGDGYWTDIL